MSQSRSPRRALAGLAVLLAVAGIAAAANPADAATASTAYYSARPVCAADVGSHPRCLGERLVRVPKGTPHARAMVRNHPAADSGPAGGYTPFQIADAYGIDADATTTKTVAVIDPYDYPTARADLQTFDDTYGIDADETRQLSIVNQDGAASPLPVADGQQPAMDYGWSAEAAIDLQSVRGMCHGCNIVLVEADDSTDANLVQAVDTAVKLGAGVVSNSYGDSEAGYSTSDLASFAAGYNHPGVVVVAASGDDGYEDWDVTNVNDYSSTTSQKVASPSTPEVPASFPSVVAVGGTSLQLNDDGTRSGEAVWNDNGPSDLTGTATQQPLGATGSGCSVDAAAPAWQTNTAGWAQTGCGTKRLSNDISVDGDPYTGYDAYDTWAVPDSNGVTTQCSDTDTSKPSCWFTAGGTSLSTALVAGMWGAAGGAQGLAYPAATLYAHNKSAPSAIHDVTVGGSGFCGGVSADMCYALVGGSPNDLGAGVLDCAFTAPTSNGTGVPDGTSRACTAATGYDGASGVGTPASSSLFTPMNPTAVLPKPGAVVHGRPANFSASASTDPYPGGKLTRFLWNFGDGGLVIGTSSRQAHTYARAGRYKLIMRIEDNYGRSSGYFTEIVTVQ